jgi:hypothetical protein
MPSHVPIRLLRRGKYKLCPADGRGVHRTIGQIIGDCPIDIAAELIAAEVADLHTGAIPSSAEFLAKDHPQSSYMRGLQRRQQEEALIRNFISQQPQ